MITKTALSSRSYLARIKAAVVEAVREAHAPHRSALGIGHAVVKDRRQRFSLRVVWRRGGKGLECFDRQDNDVTARVLEALRAWHAETRIPRMEAREATPAEWVAARAEYSFRRVGEAGRQAMQSLAALGSAL